ncbi:hypothetical protein HDU96_001191 [Phlyctochytrium bullatum]|nr:hypothetical protein HDU96_001191 [Phlyctochytrium bullatum]
MDALEAVQALLDARRERLGDPGMDKMATVLFVTCTNVNGVLQKALKRNSGGELRYAAAVSSALHAAAIYGSIFAKEAILEAISAETALHRDGGGELR